MGQDLFDRPHPSSPDDHYNRAALGRIGRVSVSNPQDREVLFDMVPLSGTEVLIASIVLCFGAYLNGALGFGMGMIAAPLLILIDPILVPGTVLVLGLFVTGAGVIRDRVSLRFRDVNWALAGRLPASFVGAAIVAMVEPSLLGVLVGLCVISGVVMAALDRMPMRGPATMFIVGSISGIMATIAAVGGPPIVLIFQDAPEKERRAALSLFFFVGTIASLIALILAGAFGIGDLLLSLLLFGPIAVGFFVGVYGPRIRNETMVRKAMLVICLVAGVAVVVRNAAQYLP